eukprot:CAMPEP_0201715274 /NCGR_PEP_ID=MMETSP0593-20130828/1489_1 /ASSEMBLY_ACC=CAM_ASM_000672 /TAXON_ID=267983 /ORGANISM="Skeletonema japonicum, Strain CCMP2506" /LENGTH=197 /DNA_ID=CAMNT_0048204721 /DNA_START=14 /DNA_END=607 /DNA_ORIENTATION=+
MTSSSSSTTTAELPLHEAVRNNDITTIQHLLSTSTSSTTTTTTNQIINAQDENGITPLIEACISGNIQIVHLLLNAGCPAQPKPGFRHSPLRGATVCGNHHLIPLLLKSGADPNAASDGNRTPLMGACFLRKGVVVDEDENEKSVLCVKALLEDERVDPTVRNSFGESALDLAVGRGYCESAALVEQAVKDWNERLV